MCPSGQCKKDPSHCSGTNSNSHFDDVDFVATSRFVGKAVRVNVLNGLEGVAAIDFPINALKPGWNVTIRRTNTELNSRVNSGSTDEDECSREEHRVVSPPFQIDVFDENGDPVTQFDPPLSVSAFARLDGYYHSSSGSSSNSKRKVCFGYSQDGESVWHCPRESKLSLQDTRVKVIKFANAETYHLTTFAVLLGDSVDKCGWDWISIASLVMTGSCMVLVSICGVLMKTKRFRALVGGYSVDARISKLEKKVKQDHNDA